MGVIERDRLSKSSVAMPSIEFACRTDAYRLASLDPDFLSGDSTRGIRFFLEYEKPEEHLRAWGVASTIVVIGSARVPANDTSMLRSIETERCPAIRWYEQAREFGRIASERGGALKPRKGLRHNVIATGGGPGIMEAANRGASDAGAPSIGFNIQLPRGQAPNIYSTPELTFQFHYFAMRKLHLAKRARALVVFPGGFGTLDELFEILNLIRTRRAPPIPVLCFDQSYWAGVINFQRLADHGMISPLDLEMLCFADDVEEAWKALNEHCVRGDCG
jgi:uncharacterized protein (TIGR00730 family)